MKRTSVRNLPHLLALTGMLAVALVVTLATGGCAALGEPSTTESLLIRYAAHADNDDFTAQVDASLVLSAVGYRAKIPITANFDVVGRALHGTVTAGLSRLGCPDYVAHVYLEEHKGYVSCYVGALVNDQIIWTDLDIDTTASLDVLAATNLLASAEFNRIALDTDDTVRYQLSVPTTSILDALMSVVDASSLPDEFDATALAQAINKEKVRSYFTKDCLIRSVSTMGMGTYAGPLSHSIPVSIKLDVNVTFDNYGKVGVNSVVVPKDVQQASTHTSLHNDDPINLHAVLGDDNALAKRLN